MAHHAQAQFLPIANTDPFRRHAPLLIALPQGLGVSGVSVWAVRLANALVASGRLVGLLLHDEPLHQPFMSMPIDPRVWCVRLGGLPPLAEAAGDLKPFIAPYREAIRRLSEAAGMPVVFSPNLLGDCYAIGAAISMVEPERIRIVGWQHSTASYDTAVLRRYEPVLSAAVCLSRAAAGALSAEVPELAGSEGEGRGRIACIPHGVDVPAAMPRGRSEWCGPRPLRLIYTGRIESATKRVGALVLLSEELARRGVAHELTLVGDGPAAGELRGRLDAGAGGHGLRCIRLVPPVQPHLLAPLLDEADAFVLASRHEGLSLSRLEAMARGCVPIITHKGSGAAEGLVDGANAFLADAPPEADDAAVAASLAHAVERYCACDRARVAHEAWRTARERFNLAQSAAAIGDLLDSVVLLPGRSWPADRACAYTAGSASQGGATGTGAVPAGGAEKLAAVLKGLAGKSVVIHGAGRHTIELASMLAQSPARIVGITDDDPGKWRTRLLGWSIAPPEEAAMLGDEGAKVTDVVISSFIHSGDIWTRRGVYERQGLGVHRVYPERATSEPTPSVRPAVVG